MPRRAILENKKRVDLTGKYIAVLEQEIADGDSESARTLALYRHIDRLGSGISKEDRFYFLACSNLQIKAECPIPDHYTEDRYFHYCRRRYWCSDCLFWALGSQQTRWMNLIRSNIATSETMHLGPVVRLEWTIPEPLNLDHLASFTRYMRQTFPRKLADAGVPPDTWMLMRAYDPVEGKIRALYLGPSGDWSTICSNRKKRSKTSTSILTALDLDLICNKYTSTQGRGEGQPSPWQPKMAGRPEYLSDAATQRLRSEVRVNEFWNRIEKAVKWAVGSVTPMLRLSPEIALKLSRIYKKQRLFATYGQLYNQKIIGAFHELVDNDNAQLVLESLMANGKSVDYEFHNPLLLAGAMNNGMESAPSPIDHDKHEVVQVGQCPECDRTLVLKVGEAGYMRKRRMTQ